MTKRYSCGEGGGPNESYCTPVEREKKEDALEEVWQLCKNVKK